MYRVINQLLEPYFLALLLAGLGVALMPRRPRAVFGLLAGSFMTLAVISLPVVGHWARWSLAHDGEATIEQLETAEAIVVLGGAIVAGGGIDPAFQLAPNSLDRCRHAAAVYRIRRRGPMLVSGGVMHEGWPPLAHVMKESLCRDGVPESDVLVESESTSTDENALRCSQLLKQRKIKRVVLVTDAICMPRASRCFQRQGIEVVPSPSRYSAEKFQFEPTSVLPTARASAGFQEVWHEWVGIVWYWLTDRI